MTYLRSAPLEDHLSSTKVSRRYDEHCKVDNVSKQWREELVPNDDPIDIGMCKSPCCKSPSPKPERHVMHNCLTPKPVERNEGSTEMQEDAVSVSFRNDSTFEAGVQSPQCSTRCDFEQTKDSTQMPKVSQGNGHESEQSSKYKSPNTSSLQTPKEESTLDLELEGGLSFDNSFRNDNHHGVFVSTESTGPSIIQDSCQDQVYDSRDSEQDVIQHACKRFENDGHSDMHILGNAIERTWQTMNVQELDKEHSKQADYCDRRMETDPCPTRQEEDWTESTKKLVIHCSLFALYTSISRSS